MSTNDKMHKKRTQKSIKISPERLFHNFKIIIDRFHCNSAKCLYKFDSFAATRMALTTPKTK